MTNVSLAQVALFLAAAVVAAPLAKLLRIGTVLGYLLVGVAIGPFGLGFVYSVYEVSSVLHFAEFGVVLLLFLIGLELRPKRLWSMRMSIFGLGGAQVAITASALALAAALAFGLPWQAALFAGLALSLSSTAFALQVLEEKGELALRHGRMAFAVLLFQDLAAIPLLALPPLFAVSTEGVRQTMELWSAVKALAIIVAVVLVGRYLLNGFYYLIARTKVKEAMTASALLTVVGITLVMDLAGLSASLGAFIAGVLLADSDYRHEIVADIAPFEGLLLGLFFTAIGMSLNLGLIASRPALILGTVAVLLAVKALVLYVIGRRAGLEAPAARRLGLVLAQGGEFAFVLFTAGVMAGVLQQFTADVLTVAVTLSMAATPLLLLVDEALSPKAAPARSFDSLPDNDGHIVIAGFGRVGQIIARVLVAKRIPVTALDANPEQVDFVRKFGAQIYYGDASRPEILEAAQTGKARGFVLAIDEIEASLRTARVVREHYPHVPIYARARTRAHAHQLMDLGIKIIRRETFLSSLDLTREVLRGLGYSERDVRFAVDSFRVQDERRLVEDYDHHKDIDKLRSRAISYARELEELFEKDAAEQAKAERTEPERAKEKRPA